MPPPPAARRGRVMKSPALHVSVLNCMPEPWPWERDWSELPADAILCVLHKLNLAELLLGGAARVCRSWRRAARDEPELWRHIDARCLPANFMRPALRLSAGQCRTFLGKNLDDEHFMLLAQRAPLLKILDLNSCYCISSAGFANALKKLPLLEELTLVDCYCNEQVLEAIARACRGLKHFRLVHEGSRSYGIKQRTDDRKALTIARMHELRSLKLVDVNLGNEGLAAIIDNCPHLEYLYIRDCCNISMDDRLTVKCARITMDYHEYFPPEPPCVCGCFSPVSWFGDDDDDDYDPDDYHDLSLYSYLGDDIDGADFEEHERILDVKSMRRYLS